MSGNQTGPSSLLLPWKPQATATLPLFPSPRDALEYSQLPTKLHYVFQDTFSKINTFNSSTLPQRSWFSYSHHCVKVLKIYFKYFGYSLNIRSWIHSVSLKPKRSYRKMTRTRAVCDYSNSTSKRAQSNRNCDKHLHPDKSLQEINYFLCL